MDDLVLLRTDADVLNQSWVEQGLFERRLIKRHKNGCDSGSQWKYRE